MNQFTFLSPKQATDYLGYGSQSMWYVLKVLREAGVPITKLGKKKILIAKTDLDNYIKTKTTIIDASGKSRQALEVEREKKLEEKRRRTYG